MQLLVICLIRNVVMLCITKTSQIMLLAMVDFLIHALA